jgi:alkylhydroperoxidase family enzyme
VKADPAIVNALRNRAPLPDVKLDVLATFARAVVKNRGMVCGKKLDNFIAAGYTRSQALEVVLGVAFKTLSNYTNHIIDPPLDTVFQAEAWEEADPCGTKHCA